MSGVAILFAAGLALPPKVLYVPEIPHQDNRCNEPDGDGSPARASSDYATRHAAHHIRRLVELKRNSIVVPHSALEMPPLATERAENGRTECCSLGELPRDGA